MINRTFHGRLGIRILSSRAESISHLFASLTRERYFQHSKIKFVSPRGHEISSINKVGAWMKSYSVTNQMKAIEQYLNPTKLIAVAYGNF